MKELMPVNQHVILDFSDKAEPQVTAGGIIIPDTAREKPKFARITAVATIENAEVKPGDLVIFKPYGGTEISFEGKKYLVLPYADILAKIIETEAI